MHSMTRSWLHNVYVAEFHVQHGPAAVWQARDDLLHGDLLFHAFPEAASALQHADAEQIFFFRTRPSVAGRRTPTLGGGEKETIAAGLSVAAGWPTASSPTPSLVPVAGEPTRYGFVLYRQMVGSDIHRFAARQSLVFMTEVPLYSLWTHVAHVSTSPGMCKCSRLGRIGRVAVRR